MLDHAQRIIRQVHQAIRGAVTRPGYVVEIPRIRDIAQAAAKRSVKELAEELELSEASVRATLNQKMNDAQKLGSKAPDNSNYWGLAARNAEDVAS